LPFGSASFDRVLCLDVLEHLALQDQAAAVAEMFRVLTPGGEALVSVPNLAHLQSRVSFLLTGRLIRTANERKHPGDRPVAEYLALARQAGFVVLARDGIFPTLPLLTRAVRRHPAAMAPVHRWLTRLVPVAGWCFLNLLRLGKPAAGSEPAKEER
jgi:2-polyprenyl-3-methyl-5-hydroxy-6-metoxy-1,4-benzoquinol methylase